MFFVRSATKDDLEAVSALLRQTWQAPHGGDPGSAEWHSPAALKANLARPVSEFIVADDGRQIGGMAYALVTEKDAVSLLQLYVLPELQGQGIGRDLFAEIETCFDGAKLLRAEVEPTNTGAIAFYERHGMVQAGTTADAAGLETIVMEKRLA